MPEEGISFLKKDQILSYEELIRIVQVMAPLGISKIRFTGGEPFLRKDIMSLIKNISEIEGINDLAITSNGTYLEKHIDELINYGVQKINLSIDSLDKERFYKITRRDLFDTVWNSYKLLLDKDVDLKLNCVVMADQNIEDIIPMVRLTENDKVSVRFIEEMPFNGSGKDVQQIDWNFKKILAHIEGGLGTAEKLTDPQFSTSLNYRIPGFKGSFGIIPAFSRTFCGTCNRIRLTPQGLLKTCLYDEGVFNIKDLIRAGATDVQLKTALLDAIGNRAKDGFEAQQSRKFSTITESMTTIGG